MKEKKYTKYFIILALIFISLLPTYNIYNYLKNFDFKKAFNLDNVEKYINYGIYKIFNKSLEQDKVISGKNKFLFLGNNYDNVLHKTNGIFKIKQEDLEKYAQQLEDLQNWYKNQNIKLIIAIAPNKHSIYKENLPNWMQTNEKTLTDNIVEFLQEKNIEILDLRSFLRTEKKQDLLYYKSDTHWNELGASLAYEKLINFLNKSQNLNITIPDFSLKKVSRSGGDLSNFLKINTLLRKNYERRFDFNFKENFEICKGQIDPNSLELAKCTKTNNLSLNYNQFMINSTAKNNYKLLLLGDSFTTAPAPLYNATFKEVLKWHWGTINGSKLANFIGKNEPDIVIYQLVERSLYNFGFLTSLPEIFLVNENKAQKEIFNIKNSKFYKNNDFTLTTFTNFIELNATRNDPIIILNELKAKTKNVILSFELDALNASVFQIFYKKDKNSAYNEKDSYRIPINIGNNKFSLLLPSKYINNVLRVDPVSSIGIFKIKKFTISES